MATPKKDLPNEGDSKNTSLAFTMMKKNRSVSERAQSYFESTKREIQRNIIDKLIERKEKFEDELFELTNFSLETNLNSGLRQMTKEDCTKRFSRIIDIEYELKLVELELESKQKSFDKYFG